MSPNFLCRHQCHSLVVYCCCCCLLLLLLLLFTVVIYCCYLLCCCSVTLQMFAIITVLGVGKLLGLVNIPNPSWDQFRRVRPSHYTVTFKILNDGSNYSYNIELQHLSSPQVFPLPIFYLTNLIFGLGSTQSLR